MESSSNKESTTQVETTPRQTDSTNTKTNQEESSSVASNSTTSSSTNPNASSENNTASLKSAEGSSSTENTSSSELSDSTADSSSTEQLQKSSSSDSAQANKKKEDLLNDLSNWPTPLQAKESPSENRKTEGEESTTPAQNSTPQEGQEDPNKKKGTNWVPFKEAAPVAPSYRQTSAASSSRGRGRRGSESRRDPTRTDASAYNAARTGDNKSEKPTEQEGENGAGRGSSSYRGDSRSSYRGSSRRGGRGGYSRGYGGYSNYGQPVVYLEEAQLKEALLKQIEYYFSIDNLVKDTWFRQQMDSEGWVPLSLIMNFNRLRNLSVDMKLVVECLSASTILEVKGEQVRKAEEWNRWLLPKSEETEKNEEASKSNEEQKKFEDKKPEQQRRGSKAAPFIPVSAPSNPPTGPTLAEIASAAARKQAEQQQQQQQHKPAPAHPKPAAANHQRDSSDKPKKQHVEHATESTKTKTEEDEWQDVTSKKGRRPGTKSSESKGYRPQRNSRNGRSSGAANGTTSTKSSAPLLPDEEDVDDEFFNKLFVVFRPPSPNDSKVELKQTVPEIATLIDDGLHFYEDSMNKTNYSAREVRFYLAKDQTGNNTRSLAQLSRCVGWVIGSATGEDSQNIPQIDHPSYALIKEYGFIEVRYSTFKTRCLAERKRLGAGKFPEMDILFRFWSHFLRNHFNRQVYQDFKAAALEDSKQGQRHGMQCLFRYLSYGLERKHRPNLYEDFQDLAIQDYNSKHLYGLEKFWAFLKYRQEKSKIERRPEISKLLERFRTMNDFRVEKKRLAEAPVEAPLATEDATVATAAAASPTATPAATSPSSSAASGTNPWFQKRALIK